MPICGNFEPICASIAGLFSLNVLFAIVITFLVNKNYFIGNAVSLCLSEVDFSIAYTSICWLGHTLIWDTDWITSQLDEKTHICEGQIWKYIPLLCFALTPELCCHGQCRHIVKKETIEFPHMYYSLKEIVCRKCKRLEFSSLWFPCLIKYSPRLQIILHFYLYIQVKQYPL